MMSDAPLLTRLTATATPPAPVANLRPIAVMIIGDRPDDVALPPSHATSDALARFRPTVVVIDGDGSAQAGFRLAQQSGARFLRIDARTGAAGFCRELARLSRPGDRVLTFHGGSQPESLRQRVADTPGLKLVEASAWLTL